jgi:hypothetical protein
MYFLWSSDSSSISIAGYYYWLQLLQQYIHQCIHHACTLTAAPSACVYIALHNCYHLQGELALLTSLLSGDSVTQHLEPYYFLALCSALQVQPPDKFVLNKNDDGTEKWVWNA